MTVTDRTGPLVGVTVVERAGRLSVAACGHLLAALGARVVRMETAADAVRAGQADCASRRLMRGGKAAVALPADESEAAHNLAGWLAVAHVVLLEPIEDSDPLAKIWRAVEAAPRDRIITFVSPAGRHSCDLPPRASEGLIQAACGLMAVTGDNEERPELAHVPVAELCGAVIGLTSVLAALRVRRRDGAGQVIDLSLVEVMADQLRSHVGLVASGQTRGFRIGCRHPLCSPWNAYRAQDGWVLICSGSNANWHGILAEIGRADLIEDPRYATAVERRGRNSEVDALVQHWVGAHTIDHVVTKMLAIAVPAGPAIEPHDVPTDPLLNRSGSVRHTPDGPAPRLAFRLSRAPGADLSDQVRMSAGGPSSENADPLRASAAARPRLPLEGIRMVEFSRYAAGPLAGYLLAALGAEVIKVEPPGGEETRSWSPRFGEVSGYFANFNAGKRFVCLDLKVEAERARLDALIAGCDVLVHNMRPGAMERLGLGADVLTVRHPTLVYCAVSGFGMQGPKIAAFDTVIQARLGLTGLIGDRQTPRRVGYSIADQLVAHFAAAGIFAALYDRDASHQGQVVDVSMADAMAWLTHPAWSADAYALNASQQRAADGWVVIDASSQEQTEASKKTRAELVAAFRARGIAAAAVLELNEVLAQPELQRRGTVFQTRSAGVPGAVLIAPYGLTATPVTRAERIGNVGEDNESLLEPAAPRPQTA